MEKYTVTASLKASNLSQMSTFQNKDRSIAYSSFPAKNYARDASFSSYLPPEAPKPAQDDTEISIFDAERYFNDNPDQKRDLKPPPLNVNLERIVERCDVSTVSRISSVSSLDGGGGYGRSYRTGSFHATPTASSEASWNSQTGLLSNPPGSISVSLKNLSLNEQRRKGNSRNWLFGRKCPCSGKKSVDVEEKLPKSRNPIHQSPNSNDSLNSKKQSLKAEQVEDASASASAAEHRVGGEDVATLKLGAGTWAKDQGVKFPPEGGFPAEIGRRIVPSGRPFGDPGFSFPILNPPTVAGKPLDDPPRESLEVFLPADELGGSVKRSGEFQRRVVMSFSAENSRRSFTFPGSPKDRLAVASAEDDGASDSSSDLFEIESFSTQGASYGMWVAPGSYTSGGAATGMLQFRRSMDETTSVAPTECYEPSEVSVDWSVTTAEGFDRASITNFSASASDFEEVRYIQPEPGKAVVGGGGGGGNAKRRGNGLLGCRCEKAVNVGPHPVKCGPDQHRMVSPTAEPARLAAMSRLAHVTPSHVPRPSDKPPLARSHSACPLSLRQ